MDNEQHHPHWFTMSPILVGLFGVLAGVIIVAICHCIITKCNNNTQRSNATLSNNNRASESSVSSSTIMAHSTIRVIVESKDSKESVRDDVCTICLGEFRQGERVRVLRECAHIFHVSCVDKWLGNHPNCPLCRACAVPSLSRFNPDFSTAQMNVNVV
ncbi:hypothetical protein ACP275_10G036500 [Erythranthe tilingii]